jgi:hypothetical protein
VSRLETIAKLEALLTRVRSRAAMPRGVDGAVSVASAASGAGSSLALDSDLPISVLPTRPPQGVAEAAAEAVELEGPDSAGDTTLVAQQDATLVSRDATIVAQETVVAQEDEPPTANAFESRERLVAAPPFDGAEAALDATADPTIAGPRPEVLLPADELPADVVAEEDVEEAPASSRRTLAAEAEEPEEQIAEIAFGAEEPSPPRHTPPPESGRLPAVAPVSDFDGDVTGVRDAPAPPHRFEQAEIAEETPADAATTMPVESAEVPAATTARIAGQIELRAPVPPPIDEAPRPPATDTTRELVPESIPGELAMGDRVAEVIGEAQRFAPPNFVALLDASLAL